MASLNEMKIVLEGIGHVLADNMLAVPIFQRSYAWGDLHVRDLFQDIGKAINNGEPEYFLGSIVISENSKTHPEVVDGQQRLATTTILIAAIRDWFFENGDHQRTEDIERDFLITRDLRTQERVSRFRLNEIDHDFFLKYVLSKPNDPDRKISPTKESHKKIAIAVANAKEHINNIVGITSSPVEVLIDWIEYLRNEARIILVRVPDHANAFTIFETLNDRGLDLAISDLLKNYLFHLSDDRIGETQQRWISMYGALEAIENEKSIVDYIRHLWSSKYGLTREKDLYEEIKQRVTSKQAALDFAEELANNARIYAAMVNPDHEYWSSFGPSVRSYISTLNLLRMIQIRPLLLAILYKFPPDPDEVAKTLRVMISWSVRFLIYGGLGGGTLERHYSERATEVRSGKLNTANELLTAMKAVVPTDIQFETSFSVATVSRSNLARYYLRALEKEYRGEAAPELIPNPNEEIVNLEHILPETRSPSWFHFEEEDAKALYKRIGNMALLKSKINFDLGNDSFQEKKKSYKDSEFRLTSLIASKDNWSNDEIEERQRLLAKLAVSAWPNKV